MTPPEDSLRKRYAFKVLTNLVGLLISLVTQSIVPRGLGPAAYGDFNFLNNFFTQFIAFFDPGASQAFFSKLSQRRTDFGIVSFFSRYAAVVALSVPALALAASNTALSPLLWPNERPLFIFLAACAGVIMWAAQGLGNMTDAHALTVRAEKVKVLQKIVGLALILLLFLTGRLDLRNFFLYQCAIYLFLGVVFVRVLHTGGARFDGDWSLTSERRRAYLREFWEYIRPLVVYASVSLVVNLFDRWLLQYYGGSVQQGFFGLSYQVGVLCFLFSGAMTPLLLREFSVAFAEKDTAKMARLYRRFLPLLFAISAYFSCFIAVEADSVAVLIGGADYREAGPALILMAYYPVFQTYGQLTGSLFYATGQTKLYRDIGIFFLLAGLPVTFVMIAPRGLGPGLGLGAIGLAAKMILFQILGVNTLLFFNTRDLGLSFAKFLGHEFACLAALTGAALAARSLAGAIPLGRSVAWGFIAAGAVYSLLAAALILLLPQIAGLGREDLRAAVHSIRGTARPS